jgi:hypothetical protein
VFSIRLFLVLIEPSNYLWQKQIAKQRNIDSQLHPEELIGVVRPIPVTDGAVEADVPFKGEEEHGTVVVMSEDVDNGMNHATEDEGQPPMPTGVGFIHEAPEEDGVDEEGSGRVQDVVSRDPDWVVEIGRVDDVLHHVAGILLKNEAIVQKRPPREQAKRQVRQDRSPQKSRFGEFELCAEFLFDGGVDDEVRGEGVHEVGSGKWLVS